MPEFLSLGADWVLLKGGHLHSSAESTGLLAGPGGVIAFPAPRIATKNNHDTGCTLSSTIAALLPRHPVAESVGAAKAYLTGALAESDGLDVGHGHGPVYHFHAFWAADQP